VQLGIGIALIVVVALGWWIWRAASRRLFLPCPTWLSWMVELDNPFAREHQAKQIIERLAVTPGMAILDAGCGPGRLAIPLASATGPQGEVVAMDAQPAMTAIVNQKARDRGLHNLKTLSAPLGRGALTEAHFERVLLVAVLGEIPDQKSALLELYHTLKPGGILSITETLFDPHYQNRKGVRQLAEETGFRLRNTFGNRLAYTMHFEKGEAHHP